MGCLTCCDAVYQIPTRIMCFVLVMVQGGILDYYLVNNKNIYWYAWVAADVALGLVFVMTFIISYRHLSVVHQSRDSASSPVQTGSLPLGYFAWFVYSLFLGARVFIIYRDVAWTLNETNVFGPNALKITVSGTGFVFLLLLMTHHDAVPGTTRKSYIEELTGTVVFDVLDAIDVLNIFFNKSQIDELPDELEISILVIACVNFLVPIFPLMTLSRMHYGHKPLSHCLFVLHKLSLVFLINLPLFIVRMLLWHVHSNDISIFPMKNLIMIFLVFHDLYDKRRASARPKHVNYIEEKDQSQIEELEENKAMFTVESTK
ncbi:uncharacterized protein LOC110449427 [Mizuhopecten yessoensis]|uniref:Cat eye syndrome critical region protein 6-like n=1 Tax=Mizuhopecten yessoensis TaxID=6573 RepID=A0A210QRA6_MIZYE|nr:uncharacterized protein LOC110449427 [Mizuhopecten yessoensis]OWF51251.1 hypothetical protein KP79_PYT11197 [Mizuhopecten yessoensis]